MKNATSERLACTSVISQMVHSVGMAGRYMSVDNGGNAASNMIRMKLLIFFRKRKTTGRKFTGRGRLYHPDLFFLKVFMIFCYWIR